MEINTEKINTFPWHVFTVCQRNKSNGRCEEEEEEEEEEEKHVGGEGEKVGGSREKPGSLHQSLAS
ncbi:hypothetical protein E2C01_001929 [Portunus trituberculatus]|uniref:Uncharacterized protein n=1 Tax=Portunus trituberculatus TaxID=210409 RepID=A0A5B7CKK5_PORTR|nr:hypothetical protein [Portunus trituberculatus]